MNRDSGRAVAIGAGDALGAAFVNKLAARKDIDRVYAFSRGECTFVSNKVLARYIDTEDGKSIFEALPG
jgi:hypothetical protein